MIALAYVTPWVLFLGWWVAWEVESYQEAREWEERSIELEAAWLFRRLGAPYRQPAASVWTTGPCYAGMPERPRPLPTPVPGPPARVLR